MQPPEAPMAWFILLLTGTVIRGAGAPIHAVSLIGLLAVAGASGSGP